MGWRRRRGGNPDANQADVLKFGRKRLGASGVVTTGVGYGFPDNVVGFHGLTILVEVKGPDGTLRDSQIDFIRRWRGGPILVVDGPEDLFQQLIDLDKRTPPVRDLPAGFRKAVTDAMATSANDGRPMEPAARAAATDGDAGLADICKLLAGGQARGGGGPASGSGA